MAWTAVHTFAVGDVLNASDLNTWLSANTDFLHQPPQVAVTHSVAQTVPDGVWTSLSFNTERFKQTDSGLHSNSTNNHELICVTPGKYFVWGHYQGPAPVNYWLLSLLGNLSSVTFTIDSDTGFSGLQNDLRVAKVVNLAAGDYVYMQSLLANGGPSSPITRVAQYSPEFGMSWLGT